MSNMYNLDEKDRVCLEYALGLLYQFIIDDFGSIQAELDRLGYKDIITLDRLDSLKERLC